MSNKSRRAGAVFLAASVLLGLLSCAAEANRPNGGESVSSGPLLPPVEDNPTVHARPPQSGRLPVENSTATGEMIPWKLVKVDTDNSRIYISAEQVDCVVPSTVHLQETDSEIVIAVTGSPRVEGPCAAKSATLVGYVQLSGPIAGRRIVGNSG